MGSSRSRTIPPRGLGAAGFPPLRRCSHGRSVACEALQKRLGKLGCANPSRSARLCRGCEPLKHLAVYSELTLLSRGQVVVIKDFPSLGFRGEEVAVRPGASPLQDGTRRRVSRPLAAQRAARRPPVAAWLVPGTTPHDLLHAPLALARASLTTLLARLLHNLASRG